MMFGLQYRDAKTNIGASPCGRKAGEPVSGTLEPSMAGARGSLTQVLNSAAAIDYTDYAGGISNVQECDPSQFMGEEGLGRLVTVIRGYFEKGGMELGLNFINEEILEDARRNPQKHMNIMVRLIPYDEMGKFKYKAMGLETPEFPGPLDELMKIAEAIMKRDKICLMQTV